MEEVIEKIKYPTEVKLPEIDSASARAIFFQSPKTNSEQQKELYAKSPDIFHEKIGEWRAAQPEGRLIIQEKMDGSNFTVYRDPKTLELHYFNKGKLLTNKESGKGESQSVFERTCDALRTRQNLFWPGYIYHGEALRATRACHIMYRQVPKFHWICYEIMIPSVVTAVQQAHSGDESDTVVNVTVHRCATPEEMTEILKDTGLEQAHIFYDSIWENEESNKRLVKIFLNINTLPSCLGNYAEGVVVKVLDRIKKDKVTPYRRKYVSDHMREHKTIEGVIAPDCTVESIEDMFNVPARFRKAVQHLEEDGKNITYETVTAEADRDLEKECKHEIMEMLWKRYWPIIKRAARKDLAQTLGFTQHGFFETKTLTKYMKQLLGVSDTNLEKGKEAF